MQTHSFEFNDVEMQYDSYRGLQVRLRFACLALLPKSGPAASCSLRTSMKCTFLQDYYNKWMC